MEPAHPPASRWWRNNRPFRGAAGVPRPPALHPNAACYAIILTSLTSLSGGTYRSAQDSYSLPLPPLPQLATTDRQSPVQRGLPSRSYRRATVRDAPGQGRRRDSARRGFRTPGRTLAPAADSGGILRPVSTGESRTQPATKIGLRPAN